MARHTTTSTLSGQDYFTTTLSAQVNLSDTIINLNAVPTATEGFLVIDPNTPATREVIYFNSATGTTVVCPDATQGSGRGLGGTTAQAHASNTAVEMRFVWEYMDAIKNGEFFPDASTSGLNPSVIFDSSDRVANYIKSGTGVIAQSSGLVGTFSNITYYIAGKRYTKTSIANKTYTASRDTYVDIDITGTVSYNESTNGAAAQALAANSVRVAKVVTSGSAITSVTQTGKDSLGNWIYQTNPASQSLIRWRQGGATGDASWATTGTSNTDTSAKTAFMQAGSILVNNASGLAVTFPVPFSQVPLVLASTSSFANKNAFMRVTSISTTGFTVTAIDYTGGTANASTTETAHWMAIGQ